MLPPFNVIDSYSGVIKLKYLSYSSFINPTVTP